MGQINNFPTGGILTACISLCKGFIIKFFSIWASY